MNPPEENNAIEEIRFHEGATLETHRPIVVEGVYLLIPRDFPMDKLKEEHPTVEEVTDEAKIAQIERHLSADKGRAAIVGALTAAQEAGGTPIVMPPIPDLTRFMPKQGNQNRAQRRAAKKVKR